MVDSKNKQNHIKGIAIESLDTLSKIAQSAKTEKDSRNRSSSGSGAGALANPSDAAVNNLRKIWRSNTNDYILLSKEPAIARVVAVDENEREKIYYICRMAPGNIDIPSILLASSRSPIGVLATRDIGEETLLPRGGYLTVLEVLTFNPKRVTHEEWDSYNSVLKGEQYGPLTIKSLRAFLQEAIDDGTEQDKTENIREGVYRNTIENMELRDQAILSREQDDIFRLPLNSCLLVLGPPGAGKTTTLIRRLGQKLDMEALSENEKQLFRAGDSDAETDHSRSWVMFSQTKLLGPYIKEAFHREGISDADEHISTWANFRYGLARNQFGILRSAPKKSFYTTEESPKTLKPEAIKDTIDWFTDFDEWQKAYFLEELRASAEKMLTLAEKLSGDSKKRASTLSEKLLKTIASFGAMIRPSNFVTLMEEDEIQNLDDSIKDSSDAKIRRALNIRMSEDSRFLDDFAVFIGRLTDIPNDPDDQEADTEDEDESAQPRIGRESAEYRYMQVVRAQARAKATNRDISPKSRNGRLIGWLGDRTLSDEGLKEIGEKLLVQTELRKFKNPVRHYISGTLSRYRRFRRIRQAEKRWYSAEFDTTDIHPLEVDVVLLAMMRGTDDLMGARALSDNKSARTTFERLKDLYRTQVFVDEVSDFSPVQLACIAALMRPGIRSFFACGDLSQRMTDSGVRSIEQMRWAIPDIKVQHIRAVYRQSDKLLGFAKQIASLRIDIESDGEAPKDYAENEGVSPVLAMRMAEESGIAAWLAERIREVKFLTRQLPSIAVIVVGKDEVQPIADALSEALMEQDIGVITGLQEQGRGQGEIVRVFDIRLIKGLEFEAVFFVGLDKLAQRDTDLFINYLYIGATRAATYLGITCEQALPPEMETLRELFGENWKMEPRNQ